MGTSREENGTLQKNGFIAKIQTIKPFFNGWIFATETVNTK
jgi:hypothetical protein